MRKTTILLMLTIGLVFGGCHRKPAKEGDFSVKDVHIPQTAEGMSAKDAEKLPVIEFETKTYDFGDVIEGERLTYAFKFKNTGKSNLIIYSSEATCGLSVRVRAGKLSSRSTPRVRKAKCRNGSW